MMWRLSEPGLNRRRETDWRVPGIVDPREITDYRGFLLHRGSSPATVNRLLESLRRYFLWAKKQRMLSDSPFEMLERVRVEEKKDVALRWLSRKEQLSLLRAVRQGENQRALAVIQVMLGAGLRISGAAAPEVSDIELYDRSGWVHYYLLIQTFANALGEYSYAIQQMRHSFASQLVGVRSLVKEHAVGNSVA